MRHWCARIDLPPLLERALHVAVIGLAAVSNNAGHAREVIDAAIRFVERTRLDADIGAVEVDVVQVF